MSAITPESYVKLVRFDVTKENQITFPDGVAQVDYFKNTLEGIEADDFTYVRQESKIRFPYIIDTIEQYNYLIVQNLPYNYKYYFYYITDMKYVNDEMTDVYINLDVFQTYQFDFIYKKSFVEREHVNNDSIGLHTVPEGLEVGEYVVNDFDYFDEFNNYIAIVTANKPYDLGFAQYRTNSVFMHGVPLTSFVYVAYNPTQLKVILEIFAKDIFAGQNAITNIYYIPSVLINSENIIEHITEEGQTIREFTGQIIPVEFSYEEQKPSTIDGYTPRNKKLLTYPYCYLVGSNNSGASNIFQYEKWKSSTCKFTIFCVGTCGGSIKLVPYEYTQNNGYDHEEGIVCGKYPVSNWITQGYQTWLNQNSANLNGQIAIRSFTNSLWNI